MQNGDVNVKRMVREHFFFFSVATTFVYFVLGLFIGYLSLL